MFLFSFLAHRSFFLIGKMETNSELSKFCVHYIMPKLTVSSAPSSRPTTSLVLFLVLSVTVLFAHIPGPSLPLPWEGNLLGPQSSGACEDNTERQPRPEALACLARLSRCSPTGFSVQRCSPLVAHCCRLSPGSSHTLFPPLPEGFPCLPILTGLDPH